jgi:nucleotide-binding universal stress UspA family protein
MSYRTILANLNIDGTAAPFIEFSVSLATRFNSYLVGFCAANITPPVTTPDGMVIDGETMRSEREEIENRQKKLHHDFDTIIGTTVSHEWREAVVSPTQLLIETARVADLIVTGSNNSSVLITPDRCINLGDLVLRAGRPVLVAAKGATRILTNTAVVAWKDTREARRAVADALPLLCKASEVIVVTVDCDADTSTQESIDGILAFLRRHGVKARSEIIKDKHENQSLMSFARTVDAELVVSGAYGHSRLRELVFGGVTRSLLKEDGFSRFMSS